MKYFYLFLLLSFFSFPLAAQFSAEISWNNGLTTGQSEVSMGSKRFSGAVFYRQPESRFGLGVEVGQQIYNPQRFGRTFSHEEFGLVTTNINEKSMSPSLDLIARLFLISGAVIEPYAEVRAGSISWFTTRKVGEGVSVASGEEVISSKELAERYPALEYHRTRFRAGIGAGTVIHLKKLLCATVEDFGFEIRLQTGLVYYLNSSPERDFSQSAEVQEPEASSDVVSNLLWRWGLLLDF